MRGSKLAGLPSRIGALRGTPSYTPHPRIPRPRTSARRPAAPGRIASIIEGREQGHYATLAELVERIDLRLCNKRVLESLVAAGACDSLGGHRKQLIEALEPALAEAQLLNQERESGQGSLFGEVGKGVKDGDVNGPDSHPDLPAHPDIPNMPNRLVSFNGDQTFELQHGRSLVVGRGVTSRSRAGGATTRRSRCRSSS